ncbi:chemotaxis protein CheB [Actinoplanes sp. NPDC020271]
MGASAGGVEALRALIAGLPANLPIAISCCSTAGCQRGPARRLQRV